MPYTYDIINPDYFFTSASYTVKLYLCLCLYWCTISGSHDAGKGVICLGPDFFVWAATLCSEAALLSRILSDGYNKLNIGTLLDMAASMPFTTARIPSPSERTRHLEILHEPAVSLCMFPTILVKHGYYRPLLSHLGVMWINRWWKPNTVLCNYRNNTKTQTFTTPNLETVKRFSKAWNRPA